MPLLPICQLYIEICQLFDFSRLVKCNIPVTKWAHVFRLVCKPNVSANTVAIINIKASGRPRRTFFSLSVKSCGWVSQAIISVMFCKVEIAPIPIVSRSPHSPHSQTILMNIKPINLVIKTQYCSTLHRESSTQSATNSSFYWQGTK